MGIAVSQFREGVHIVRKNKWVNLSAVVVLGSIFAVGCAALTNGTTSSVINTTVAGAASTQPVTITFYEGMGSAQGTELQKLTSEFEAKNPNVKVNLVYEGSYTTLQEKLTAAIAAHNAPTISQVEDIWETEYDQDKLLDPVQNLLPKSTINDLMPIWKSENTYNGTLVSAPFNKSDYVLYYNTDDFKKAGISTPPKNWTQIEQDAIKLKKAGQPTFGMQANYYTFEMFLMQAGGQILNKDNTKAAFNSAAGKKALEFMYKLANTDKAATVINADAYLSDGFNTNEFGMDIDTVAALSYITNKNVHFMTAPLPKDVTAAVPTAGTNIVIFNSASAAQKKAAAAYLNFLLSDASTVNWAEATGYVPVRTSAIQDPAWKAYIAKHPTEAAGPNELTNAYFSPRIASLGSAETEETTQIGNYIAGKQSLTTTLNNMANEVNQALASN